MQIITVGNDVFRVINNSNWLYEFCINNCDLIKRGGECLGDTCPANSLNCTLQFLRSEENETFLIQKILEASLDCHLDPTVEDDFEDTFEKKYLKIYDTLHDVVLENEDLKSEIDKVKAENKEMKDKLERVIPLIEFFENAMKTSINCSKTALKMIEDVRE